MKRAQLRCAQYAPRRLGVPVVLEYEDDSFADVHGRADHGLVAGLKERRLRDVLGSVSGVIAPSPYLLSQCPAGTPKLLLRAVVSRDILRLRASELPKRDWVVFSGTLEHTQGLEQTITAWRAAPPSGWELHIAGQGPLEPALRRMADGDESIVFHGFLNREANARLLCTARIGLNPQDATQVPGNTFAFKIVEYMAAGNHVITTPRGAFEPSLESGVTYISDNSPATIGHCLRELVRNGGYEQTAETEAHRIYAPGTVSRALNDLLVQVAATS
jgi:glycosyltransferase involved in cell wall biosynthesis